MFWPEGLTRFEQPKGVAPTPPDIPNSFLLVQFGRDEFGKEVQSAATYSYLWIADQMGHVAVGLLVHMALMFVMLEIVDPLFGLGVQLGWANAGALLLVTLGVCYFEYRTYTSAVSDAAGSLFPLDSVLLRRNAVTASAYMIFGAVASYGAYLPGWWSAAVFVVTVIIAVFWMPPWLRQKITWQKAALPYLFRLADSGHDIGKDVAEEIQQRIDTSPVGATPWQIVLIGAAGSGRTTMACGLGTEFAFKKRKVRFMSFGTLLELSSQCDGRGPDTLPPVGNWGPNNIFFWPWFESQYLIIDDISPIVTAAATAPQGDSFPDILRKGLGNVAAELRTRNTIWVFGFDQNGAAGASSFDAAAEQFARDIQAFCQADELPLIVQMPPPQGPAG